MIGTSGHEKAKKSLRECVIGHQGFQIYSKKGGFICYFMVSDEENEHLLKNVGYPCNRTGSQRWM